SLLAPDSPQPARNHSCAHRDGDGTEGLAASPRRDRDRSGLLRRRHDDRRDDEEPDLVAARAQAKTTARAYTGRVPQNVDALNAGFAGQLLEQYLENPSSVPEEWRLLFESDGAELVRLQPGLERLLERRSNGAPSAPPAPSEAAPPAQAVAAAGEPDYE